MIPDSFHIDYNPDEEEEQPPTVPMLTMHEFLTRVAEFIDLNSSSEDIELFQPAVLKRIARVLARRHEGGWSLEPDYEQQLEQDCEQQPEQEDG